MARHVSPPTWQFLLGGTGGCTCLLHALALAGVAETAASGLVHLGLFLGGVGSELRNRCLRSWVAIQLEAVLFLACALVWGCLLCRTGHIDATDWSPDAECALLQAPGALLLATVLQLFRLYATRRNADAKRLLQHGRRCLGENCTADLLEELKDVHSGALILVLRMQGVCFKNLFPCASSLLTGMPARQSFVVPDINADRIIAFVGYCNEQGSCTRSHPGLKTHGVPEAASRCM